MKLAFSDFFIHLLLTIPFMVLLIEFCRTCHSITQRYREARLGFMLWKRGQPPSPGWWWMRGPGVEERIVRAWFNESTGGIVNDATAGILGFGRKDSDYEHAGPIPYALESKFRE